MACRDTFRTSDMSRPDTVSGRAPHLRDLAVCGVNQHDRDPGIAAAFLRMKKETAQYPREGIPRRRKRIW